MSKRSVPAMLLTAAALFSGASPEYLSVVRKFSLIEQDRLARGLEPATGHSLDYAKQGQLRQAGGHAAQHRGNGEDSNRPEKVVAAAEVG